MIRAGSMLSESALGVNPFQAGNAVVEAGGKRRDFRSRRGAQRIAEVDHRDGDAVGGDHPAPGPVIARVARH